MNLVTRQIYGDKKGNAALNSAVIASYGLANGVDSSPNAYDATVGSSITYSAVKNGNGSNFDNTSNAKITLPQTYDFAFTDGTNDKPFSLRFFIKFNDTRRQIFFGEGGNIGMRVDFFNSAQMILYMFSPGGFSYVQTDSVFTTNVLYEIVLTSTGVSNVNGTKLYVNNSEPVWYKYPSGSYTRMDKTLTNRIIGQYNGGSILNGQMDEFTIFNRALTAVEVDYLYNGGAGKFYPF
jgi:hypothetical protein